MSENPDIAAEINSYAKRCFRDVGDLDYIAARMSYRAALGAQFLWSAQQAVEKYLKCILILNRQPTGDLFHNLQLAFDRINTTTDHNIILSKAEQTIFKQLDNFGANRYLEMSWSIYDREVLKLDMLVWHLRQYCRPMVDVVRDGKTIPIRQKSLEAIKTSRDRPPQYAYIPGGKLEEILRKKNHPARSALVWQNMFFSAKERKTVRFRNMFHAENAPLYLRPQILKYIEPLVRLSKDAKTGYPELERKRLREQKKK